MVVALYKTHQLFPKGNCPRKLETWKKYPTQKVAVPDLFSTNNYLNNLYFWYHIKKMLCPFLSLTNLFQQYVRRQLAKTLNFLLLLSCFLHTRKYFPFSLSLLPLLFLLTLELLFLQIENIIRFLKMVMANYQEILSQLKSYVKILACNIAQYQFR